MSNIRVFGLSGHEKKIFENSPNFTRFDRYWAPIDASPLVFTNLNPHSPKILPTKFGIDQFSSFGEEVL